MISIKEMLFLSTFFLNPEKVVHNGFHKRLYSMIILFVSWAP